MRSFLRISSYYPGVLIDFKNKNKNLEKMEYEQILNKFFSENYAESNNYSKYLSKFGYNCTEIVSNDDFFQKKWLEKYGNNKDQKKILLCQIDYYKPEILFFGNPDILNDKLYSELKNRNFIKCIVCFICSPVDNNLLKKILKFDGVITCTEGYKRFFLETGKIKHVMSAPHSFDFEEKNNFNYEKSIDVTFLGSLFIGQKLHNDRINLLYYLNKKIKTLRLYLNFPDYLFLKVLKFLLLNFFKNFYSSVTLIYKFLYLYFCSLPAKYGNDMYAILRKSKITINMHIGDTKYAGNMRLFEATGSRCLLITDNKKGIENLFNINDEIVVYENFDDLLNKINFYLDNNTQREMITMKGYNKTFTNYNYKIKAKNIDNFFSKIIKKHGV